ncbi:MAG: hypothetical protein KVP17_003408 [Porospora cf. gigantea B]|uniref:uncharacterized protein n=1 Tax=Porospora cf. gigantea B TaxID=2853592 RepID=UPI003571CD75|nr:MAG: hypothetical protein KVP17_003408 [Porospora cf. gigantea B]
MPRLNLFAKKQKLKQQGGSGSSEQSEERVVRRTGTAGIFSKPYYDFKGRPAPSTAETASKTDLSSPRPPDVSVRRFSSIRVPTPVLVEGTTRTERYTGSQRHVGDFQGETYVVSQHVKKHRVRRPKRIVREEIVEKVVVVPERFVKEEIVESSDEVSELIVERVTPIVQKYEIEVPEIRYVDKVVEVPEVVVEEKVVYVPKKVVEEVQVTVPKIIIEEKIVEVPEIIYNEYDVEKVVEVPQVIQKEVEIPVPVPQYVDKPYPVQVDIDQPVAVPRNIPLPLEHILTYEYHLPRYNVIKDQIPFNVYLPKFVEVPVPALQADRFFAERAEWVSAHIEAVMGQQSSLCEIENTVEEAKQLQQQQARGLRESVDFVTALRAGWLKIEDDSGREIPNPHVSENGMTHEFFSATLDHEYIYYPKFFAPSPHHAPELPQCVNEFHPAFNVYRTSELIACPPDTRLAHAYCVPELTEYLYRSTSLGEYLQSFVAFHVVRNATNTPECYPKNSTAVRVTVATILSVP